MAEKKLGNQTVTFSYGPYIIGAAAVGGKKEGQGPLGDAFDVVLTDDMYEEKTWEKAESKMLKKAMTTAIEKSTRRKEDIDLILSGDLVNQTMSSSFMARDLQLPFLGLYGACSTMAESLLVGSMLIDGGFAANVLAGASSHYCTAERQFRMPLEHGNQRPMWASWTATAAGAVVISEKNVDHLKAGEIDEKGNVSNIHSIFVDCGTVGKVIDAGVKDANQMGSAMAPAAVDTILNHLEDTGRTMDYYDKRYTGDLGFIGKDIAADLFIGAGIPEKVVSKVFDDCGTLLYDRKKQDVHGGGSGCGCSASVFAGEIIGQLKRGELSKVLLVSTGALLSTTSPFQGESIPGIAHGVAIESV